MSHAELYEYAMRSHDGNANVGKHTAQLDSARATEGNVSGERDGEEMR